MRCNIRKHSILQKIFLGRKYQKKLQKFSFNINDISIQVQFPVMYSVYDYGVVTHTHTEREREREREKELATTCPVKFVTTCPSVIFLFATGLSPPCFRYRYHWPAHALGNKTLFKII